MCSIDQLDNSQTCLGFFQSTYPNNPPTIVREIDEWRQYLGRFGVSGRMQTSRIGTLSEGQKSRLVYAMICMRTPNMLLLDEPTKCGWGGGVGGGRGGGDRCTPCTLWCMRCKCGGF